MLDLIFEGGVVYDGAGNPGFRGAVGVEGDRLHVIRGDTSAFSAERRIDVGGQAIAPGFIDMHAHSGLTLLTEPEHHAKIRQGITTEVIGVDGNSYAPFPSADDFERFAVLNAGLDGDPPEDARWLSVDEYLSVLDGRAVNVAYVVGNSPLRVSAAGWEDRTLTGAETGEMRAILRRAMEEGAFGMSTGLDYPPGSYADTDELVELCTEAASLGGIYHTHVRYALGDRWLDPFREALEIGRRSGIAVHLTHFYQRQTTPGSAHGMLDLVEQARAEGLDVTFDSYPYAYSSTKVTILLPQSALDGGLVKLRESVGSPGARSRLRDQIRPRGGSWEETWMTNFGLRENRELEGRSMAEIAEARGGEVVDVLLDLLVAEDFRLCYVATSAKRSTLPRFITHPLAMIGSDALLVGDYPSPRSYGTFPRILADYVREERLLSLSEAIRKMTSFAAQRLGIPDRGLLRSGLKADLVVFDPQTIDSDSTRRDPRRFPTGIDYVVVNGEIAVENSKPTGVLAGRALRRGA